MGVIARRAQKYKSVDNYLKELWRPLMAWNYAIIVLFDFMLAPIGLSIYTVITKQPYIQWQPLTIQGGGMFHIAMGAVIGVSAWSRGKEKLNGSEGAEEPAFSMPTSWDPSTVKSGPVLPAYAPPPGYQQTYQQQPYQQQPYQQPPTQTSPQLNINVEMPQDNSTNNTVTAVTNNGGVTKTATGYPKARLF